MTLLKLLTLLIYYYNLPNQFDNPDFVEIRAILAAESAIMTNNKILKINSIRS